VLQTPAIDLSCYAQAPGSKDGLAQKTADTHSPAAFSPSLTQEFLSTNGLSLILRSHEGPDARDKRTDLGQVLNGHALDHDVPGKCGSKLRLLDGWYTVVEQAGCDQACKAQALSPAGERASLM
jgi:hypothetical protein